LDGTGFAAGMVAWEASFQGCEGTWAETGIGEVMLEVGWSVGVDSGVSLGDCGWWGLS
jgi:hypothetical protein